MDAVLFMLRINSEKISSARAATSPRCECIEPGTRSMSHLLTVRWVLRTAPPVPVREVEAEMAGGVSVVHVVMLHRIQRP